RDWTCAALDPDLPIRISASKCEVLAFDTVDHSLADMLGIINVRRQLFKGVGQEQIGPRHGRTGGRLDYIDNMINRAGFIGLAIGFRVVAVDRQCLAIVSQLDLRVTAGSPDLELVGPAQLDLPGAGELNLLKVRRENLNVAVEARRDGF